jgi:hypothetical protein
MEEIEYRQGSASDRAAGVTLDLLWTVAMGLQCGQGAGARDGYFALKSSKKGKDIQMEETTTPVTCSHNNESFLLTDN